MITFSVINAQKKYDNIVRNFNTFWNKKRENPLNFREKVLHINKTRIE